MISYINDSLIAVDLNVNYGFPPDTPALAGFRMFYDFFHKPGQGQGKGLYSRGFTKSVVITPDATRILNQTPNAVLTDDWKNNPNYNGSGYLQFLQTGKQKWERMLAFRGF